MVIKNGVTTSAVVRGRHTFKTACPSVPASQLVAVLVVTAVALAVALPDASMVATFVFELLQVTWLETSKTPGLPAASVKLPVARNFWLPPGAAVEIGGDTLIELS